MKTMLLVKAALLGLPIYGVAAWYGMPFAGGVAGLVYALGWSLVRYRGALPPVFEVAQILGFGAVVAAHLAGIAAKPNAAVPESNWLPSAPGKGFSLTLRTYVPKDVVKRGEWFPPAIKRLK